MTLLTPAQIDDLKRRNPCHGVAGQWVSLRPKGKGYVGPCPLHSKDSQARDSTSFECDDAGWKCAVCTDGGDVIKLVALVHGLDPARDFRKAIGLLPNGPGPVDQAEAEKAEAWRQEREAQRQAEHNQWRERARGRAYKMLKYTGPLKGSAGERYLQLRLGARDTAPAPHARSVRFDPAARYYVEDRPQWRLVHTGPAIVSVIARQDESGEARFLGLHRTFIDLDNPPKFKARIVDPKTGDALQAKTMHGAKKGGHIDLFGAAEPETVLLGEGLEKVAAVWAALTEGGRDVATWAAWSAGDLGNMGGKAAATVAHPTLASQKGRRLRVGGPLPDLGSPGILLPASVKRVILLGDSTSDSFTTQCAMARAAARFKAQREDIEVAVAWGPEGQDFDDVLRESE